MDADDEEDTQHQHYRTYDDEDLEFAFLITKEKTKEGGLKRYGGEKMGFHP